MQTNDQENLLRLLATEYQRLSSMPSPDKPEKLWPLPALEGLARISAEQVRRAFGEPDKSGPLLSDGAQEWCYSFVRLPKGWRGGGPSLHFRFDSDGMCAGASWKLSR